MKGIDKKTNGRRKKEYTGFDPCSFTPYFAQVGMSPASKYAKGRQTNKTKRRKK